MRLHIYWISFCLYYIVCWPEQLTPVTCSTHVIITGGKKIAMYSNKCRGKGEIRCLVRVFVCLPYLNRMRDRECLRYLSVPTSILRTHTCVMYTHRWVYFFFTRERMLSLSNFCDYSVWVKFFFSAPFNVQLTSTQRRFITQYRWRESIEKTADYIKNLFFFYPLRFIGSILFKSIRDLSWFLRDHPRETAERERERIGVHE